MKWSHFLIQRPHIIIVFSAFLLILGLYSYSRLPIRLYPALESSVIEIQVDYPGASPSTMKDVVGQKIAEALGNPQFLDYSTSTSSQGELTLALHLKVGYSAQKALSEILAKIMSLHSDLPPEVHAPLITIQDANENPDWLLAFSAVHENSWNLSDYIERNIKPHLDLVRDIYSLQVLGPHRALKIQLNIDQMTALGLETSDIVSALEKQNRMSSSGWLQGKNSQWPIILHSELSTSREFNNLIIKNQAEKEVYLRDVATIGWGSETDKIRTFYNGQPAVLVSAKLIPKANSLSVFGFLRHELTKIKSQLPSGVSVHELVNGQYYLHALLHEMLKTFFMALFVTLIITVIFFKDFRSAFIIALSIPISLLSAGSFLWAFGVSINGLSLLAMIVVMGLLVDDAIVVVENIMRYKEKAYSPFESTYFALPEVAFSVIAMTITLSSLFLPILFLGGITGGLFFDFAMTLVASVLISGAYSLTLLPIISTHYLNYQAKGFHNGILKVQEKYVTSVKICFEHKKILIFITLFFSVFGAYSYWRLPCDFAPKEDAHFLEVLGQASNSTNTNFVMQNAQDLSKIYRQFSAIRSYSVIVGVPFFDQFLSFIRLHSNAGPIERIRASLQSEMNKNPNLNAVAILPSLMPGDQSMPLEFVIESQHDYRDLSQLANRFLDAARKSRLFLYVEKDLQYDQGSFEWRVHRRLAAAVGVSLTSIEDSLTYLLNENSVQTISYRGELYPLILQGNADLRSESNLNEALSVRGFSGKLIPLSNFIESKKFIQPAQLHQFQKFNSVTISAVMSPEYSLSQGVSFFKDEARNILPPSVSYDFSGNARQFIQEGHRMIMLFVLAAVFIFTVLSLQFASFRDPLIIMLGSVPVALFGAMIPFELGLARMNIYSQMGVLLLCGLVSKHGILITQFANDLCRKGFSKKDAIMQSISIRFRPIVMTSLAMILGALPLLLSTGAGFEARFSFGLVILSGMIVGTIFSLFILPIFYIVFNRQEA